MSAYRKDFDKTKCMSFLIKHEKFARKIWLSFEKVSNIIKKEFDGKPADNEKCIKTKIKSFFLFSMIMIYTRHWYWIIKKTKKNKEQNIKTRLNIHRRSNASMNVAQNI